MRPISLDYKLMFIQKFDTHSKRAHDPDSRQAVLSMKEVPDMNGRVAESREHNAAVRDRFIPRDR